MSFYNYSGFHEQTADGKRSGFGYEVCELLAKKAGWTNRYIGYEHPWGDMEKMVLSGEIEILDSVRKTPEREKIYEFSAEASGYSYGYVLVRTNETRYLAGDYANWGKVRVGEIKGEGAAEDFSAFSAVHGLDVERHVYRGNDELLAELNAGRVDMVIIDSMADVSGFKIVEGFNPKPNYFCVKKGNKALMAEIDKAMAAAYEENPAWYIELRRKYFPVQDVTVYLPRRQSTDEVITRYLKAMSYLLGAIGNWNPVFRTCAEDFADADFSKPCIVGHVRRSKENLERFDFPFVPVCRRPIYLACDPKDKRFGNGVRAALRANPACLRIGYVPSKKSWLKCFLAYAVHRNIAYTLVPFETTDDLRKAALTPAVDLAILGLNPQGELRRIEECGSVEFDFVTPKEQPALRQKLDMASRYMRYHERAFLRKLEKYAYGITDVGRIVRVGVYAEFGAIDIASDGSISGFIAEYLREVARNRNWDVIFVPMMYSEVFGCLAAGEIDIAFAAGCTPERSDRYACAKRETGVLRYALKVKSDSVLQPNRPDLWYGNRIGFLAGSRPVDELRNYLDGIGADYRLVPYSRLQDAIADVANGSLEGIYTLHARESRDYRTIAVFPSLHSYFYVSNQRPDIKSDLDAAMDYFASNNVDFNWWLNNFYLRGSREIMMLDPDEIAYVRRNRGRKVTIGFPVPVDPVAHFDEESGEARGFLAALFREIAEKAGLEVTFTGKGRADVYATQREAMDDRDDLIRDREWYPLPTVRVSLPDDRIPQAARGVWAVESNRVDEIDFVRRSSLQVLECGSREECYRAVVQGRAEATIDNIGTARLMIDERREFSGLHNSRIDPARWSRQVAIAFPPEVSPELRSILIKARVAISPSAAEKMFVDAIVDCRSGRFSREDLIHYGVMTGVLVVLLLGIGYVMMHAKRQQDAARARTKFFFNVSHDVRTPIHAIMGFVDIGLSSLNDRNKVKECLLKTKEAGGLLMSLIKSVLDMSRIEAGKVTLEESVGDVYLSFVDIETTLHQLAREKNIKLIFGFGDIIDRFVYADYELCTRVFVNIITNAVKYTPNGGQIEVTCEQVKDETMARWNNQMAWYRYTFTDNGVGMSEEFQKRLYEKFSREKNTTMSGVSGLGLGMAICKSFVHLLGGRIECKSQQNVGTTFVVTLPFRLQHGARKYIDPMTGAVRDKDEDRRRAEEMAAGKLTAKSQPAKEAVPQKPAAPLYAGRRALLVDDSRLNREVACHYLRQAGFSVETAENGQEAVTKACGKPYDIVLMDIQMPVMDGYEATRRIREWESRESETGRRRLPIVAWTANAFDEDREAALAAGMDGHVAKGIKINALLDELAKFCPSSQA